MTKKYLTIYILTSIFAIILCLFFGYKKQGYYLDEYYTYTLSNGTQLGIAMDMGKWNDTGKFTDQLISTGSENFSFSQTYENNENDVHPPLYYFLIHFVSSVFSGTFLKWIGIAVNTVLFMIAIYIFYLLAYELLSDRTYAAMVTLFYASSPAIISGVMLTRMYVQLSIFVMLITYIILQDMKRDKISIKGFLLPVALVGFLGFLTQYYFVIYMFFISASYCVYLLINKEIKRIFAFGIAALIGLVATYFVWPVSVFHIFKGYRGKDAFSNAMTLDKTFTKIFRYVILTNDNLYGGLLILVMIAAIFGIVVFVKKKDKVAKLCKPIVVLLSSLCYFAVVAKVGLYNGWPCNRFVYPVYGLFLLLTFMLIRYLLSAFITDSKKTIAIMMIVTLGLNVICYAKGQVLFLYPEDKELVDYLAQNKGSKAIAVVNDDGTYDNIIRDMINYSEVLAIDCEKEDDLSALAIDTKSDVTTLYITVKTDNDKWIELIKGENPQIKDVIYFATIDGKFNVYKLQR